MTTRKFSAFTLIEMLTVMAVIAILASLIVAVNGLVQKKAATLRTQGVIKTLSAACESYKADNGNYPRDFTTDSKGSGDDSWTDKIDPRATKYLDISGTDSRSDYEHSSLYLYKCLSGDWVQGVTPDEKPKRDAASDGKPETKSYFEFLPNQIHKNSAGEIKYIEDPFGNPYGYSTAGARAEEEFREELQKDPKATRSEAKGFSPGFDLWSTGGVIRAAGAAQDDAAAARKRWIKSWY